MTETYRYGTFRPRKRALSAEQRQKARELMAAWTGNRKAGYAAVALALGVAAVTVQRTVNG